MASYASYKKIKTDQFEDGSIGADKIALGAGNQACVKWIYNERALRCQTCSAAGGCCEQANGKCCLWTVPDGVSKVTFEIWSGGGGGAEDRSPEPRRDRTTPAIPRTLPRQREV